MLIAPQRNEAAPGAVISINLVSLKGGIAESSSASFDDAKFIMNLQPATAEAGFDMRLPPMSSAEMDAVERMIREEWAPASLNFSVTFTIQARALPCKQALRVAHRVSAAPFAGQTPAARRQRVRDVHGRGGEPVVGRVHSVNGGPGAADRAGHLPGRHRRLLLARQGHSVARLLAHAVRACGSGSGVCQLTAHCSAAPRRTPKLLHEHDEFLSVDTYREGIAIYERLIADLADFPDLRGARDEL